MNNTNPATEQDPPPGWHIWQSQGGHWWGTRDRQYDQRAEAAGAWRTVDGDTPADVRHAIDAQEAIVASWEA